MDELRRRQTKLRDIDVSVEGDDPTYPTSGGKPQSHANVLQRGWYPRLKRAGIYDWETKVGKPEFGILGAMNQPLAVLASPIPGPPRHTQSGLDTFQARGLELSAIPMPSASLDPDSAHVSASSTSGQVCSYRGASAGR